MMEIGIINDKKERHQSYEARLSINMDFDSMWNYSEIIFCGYGADENEAKKYLIESIEKFSGELKTAAESL